MKRYITIIGIGIVLLLLVTYYLATRTEFFTSPEDKNPSSEISAENAVTFICTDERSIDATFYPETDTYVDLTLSDGRTLSVPHATSASGARYANEDESFVFWNKGNMAFIAEQGTTTYARCTVRPEQPEGISYEIPPALPTTYIEAINWPPVLELRENTFQCTTDGHLITSSRLGEVTERTVGDTTFCVTEISEGAAGSVFTEYAYAFPHEEQTAVLTFSLRFSNCQNYPETQSDECVLERDTFSIDPIIADMATSLTVEN